MEYYKEEILRCKQYIEWFEELKRLNNMTKCDFCTKSDQKVKCFWGSALAREHDCKIAIDKMVKALSTKNSKRGFFRNKE